MLAAKTLRIALGGAVLFVPGCVDRVIIDQTGSGGWTGGEEEFPDGDSDSAAEVPVDPEPEPEPIPVDPDVECTNPEDCDEGQTCFEGTCVGAGEFRVSLSWEVVSDFDLHVRTPSGVEVWYGEPQVASGYLDVDDCVGGDCRDNDAVHVENVFFNAGAERGTYQVWVVNFDGVNDGDFRIQVAGATDAEFTGDLPQWTGAQSDTFTFEY